MHPAPSIEQLRLERPDLSNEQLRRRERRFRLQAQAGMTRFPGVLTDPPDHPDEPWAQEAELEAWTGWGRS